MTSPRPILCVYDGSALQPATAYQARLIGEQFGAGKMITGPSEGFDSNGAMR